MRRSYDATGIDLEGDYAAAPEGIYKLQIMKVTDTKDGQPWKSRNGDDFVLCECEIADAGDWLGKKVWMGITVMDPEEKGAGIAVKFLKAIDEPHEGKFMIDSDRWVGKVFAAKLIETKDNKGRPKNEVAYLVDESAPESEVPF